jgi:hypothetical protein
MSTTDSTAAIQKAETKRAIAAKLASLPRDAQRDVLADLLLALDEKTARAPADTIDTADNVEPDDREPMGVFSV